MQRTFTGILLLLGSFLFGPALAQTDTGYKWWDPAGNSFPVVEGQGWPREADNYVRFPARAEKSVRDAVWRLSRASAGLLIRFRTNAAAIQVRYGVSGSLDMPHMPTTGVSGVDLYALSKDGEWEWSAGKYSFGDTISYRFESLEHSYTREYRLYLPLYNSVEWLEIGVPGSAAFEPLPLREEKPVVIYGTSIAQGACASRPGLAWTAKLGRKLDRPVINLGFSGNGRLEDAVTSLLTELDPKLYVIDCLPNMPGFPDDTIRTRLIRTVKKLREARPEAPVLVVEHADESQGLLDTARGTAFERVNKAGREAFAALKKDGVEGIYFLRAAEIGLDIESTVDGVHPNDAGMEAQAAAYEKIIREILREPQGEYSTTRPVIQYRDGLYDWDARHRALLQMNRTDPPELVFLGNSITHYWGGEPEAPRRRGQDSWEEYLAPAGGRNFGFGWDRVENVLWRVYHDELDGYRARQVVLMIGTNNLQLDTDEEILEGLRMLVRAVRDRQPSAKILMLGIYPRRKGEERVRQLNEQIALLAGNENARYADPGVVLLDGGGKIREELFTDGLHPNGMGYRLLGEALAPYLEVKH